MTGTGSLFSAGVETDINTSNGTYSASGVAGLTPVNFNANPVKKDLLQHSVLTMR